MFVQFVPLLPALANGRGQVHHLGQPLGPIRFLFDPGDFRVDGRGLGRQPGVALVDLGEFVDLRLQFLPLGQELQHQPGAALGVDQAVPRGFHLSHHVDQRHAVQSDRQVVEQVGGIGVAERGEFLNLPQTDGEDVVEHRFVDVREEDFQEMLALAGAVRGGQRKLLARNAVGLDQESSDLEAAARTGHVDRSAGASAVQGGKIMPARRRKTVQHRAEELQQGRLAGLVRAVEDVERIGEPLDAQPAPNAVTFNVEMGDFHASGSSPVNSSAPRVAAPRRTRSRAVSWEKAAAAANSPARSASHRYFSSPSCSPGFI